MQRAWVVRWLFFSYSCIVSGRGIDWNELKQKLSTSDGESAAVKIASIWSERPLDFFQGLEEDSWLKLGLHLSALQKDEIVPREFELIAPELLKDMLYQEKLCPTTDISFWTEERIQHISAECLSRILMENKAPVRLGELWRKINRSVMSRFTDAMKPSLRNVDVQDSRFMQPYVLEVILKSVPEFCSALGVGFWTKETIKEISGDCLHELLTKYETPVKLGDMWENVSISCCNIFEKADFSLDSVHRDDRLLAGDWIGKVIKILPSICRVFDTSFWNRETIKYMSRFCLYEILLGAKKPFALGKLWEHIPPAVLEEFKDSILSNRTKNIASSDFQYMPASLLQSVFSLKRVLDYLPQPPSGIILSARASEVSIDSLQFANLVKLAPSVAGQLLWYSTKLPENVLTNCEGNDIHGLRLAIPGEAELDWGGLFAKLENKYFLDGRAEAFAKMIRSISENARVHFCATLSDPDEYLSLTWLHSNMSEKCRKVLPFDPEYVSRLFGTLDLSKESYSWEKMLGVYSGVDWTLLSQSKRVAAILGGDCNFWGAIEAGGWLSVFEGLDRLTLRSILPECVLKMPGILANSCDKIPLLADDAFSKHVVDQLTCHISNLSAEQIACVSKKIFDNIDKPSTGEISRHALSRLTLDDLKALNLQQFKSLYECQWVFVPGDIKSEALSWQLDSALSRVLVSAQNIKDKESNDNSSIDDPNEYFKTIEDTLSLVLEIYRDGHQTIPDSNLVLLIASIRDSDLRETFIKIFENSTLLKPAIISIVRNAKELRDYNHKGFVAADSDGTKVALTHDRQLGFDRSAVIKLLKRTPESFAAPQARIDSQGIIDGGGGIRALTDQLLNDIERDLVVSYVKVSMGKRKSENKTALKVDGNPDTMSASDTKSTLEDGADPSKLQINNAGTSNAKFVWGISKEAGLIVGLALGKALQLDIQLPFGLDLGFYELLIDTSDNATESYYKATYSQEVSEYRRDILGLFNAGDFDTLLDIIPRLDSLYFTGLSTEAEAEADKAKQDLKARTNLRGCIGEDCYEDIKELDGKKYIETVLEKTRNEFKEFVSELVRGLGMALPSVKGFNSLPVPVLRPFAEFLPGLLNAAPVKGENVLERVKFEGDNQVPSLVQGQTIAASAVFSAFVLSLGTKQLEHLIGLWAGSSTLLLKYSELSVTFMSIGDIPSYLVNFCEAGKGNHLIASGEEYRAFFTKFSEKLLGPGVTASPDCGPERAGIIPVRPSTCAKNLMVYLQPAEQMLNSLVDLLRTPLTTLRDNQ